MSSVFWRRIVGNKSSVCVCYLFLFWLNCIYFLISHFIFSVKLKNLIVYIPATISNWCSSQIFMGAMFTTRVIFEDLKLGVSYFDVVWYNCSFTHAFMEKTKLKNLLKKKLIIFLIRIMRSILLFLYWKLIYSLLVKNDHIWNNFKVNHFSLTVNKVYLVKCKRIVSGVIDNTLIPKIFLQSCHKCLLI